ncbi:hypothetical protein EVA_12473 [gut metagenome]|uniref:Uncharacterized protein n=1 Tax=gut metagenome TaxID=749906 RepID=J9GCB0_9ZZZZ
MTLLVTVLFTAVRSSQAPSKSTTKLWQLWKSALPLLPCTTLLTSPVSMPARQLWVTFPW